MNRGALIDAVINEGGFDTETGAVSRDTVAGWVSDAVRQLVAETMWLKMAVELGPTVAGTAQYVIPENVLDIRQVNVDGNGYLRVGPTDIFDLRSGASWLTASTYGAFAPGYNAAGQQLVELFPTPEMAGLSVQALAAVSAPALTQDSDVPAVPEDFHPAIKAKAIATGLRLIYERHDDADNWEQQFSDPRGGRGAVQLLKRRMNSRVGSGPVRIKLVG